MPRVVDLGGSIFGCNLGWMSPTHSFIQSGCVRLISIWTLWCQRGNVLRGRGRCRGNSRSKQYGETFSLHINSIHSGLAYYIITR